MRGLFGLDQRLGAWQSLAVDLAVEVLGQRGHPHQVARHHGARQQLFQVRAQLFGRHGFFTAVVGGKLVAAVGGAPDLRGGLVDAGERADRAFDFGQLNAHAVDLDLAVRAADELDAAVGAVAAEVAGLVDAVGTAFAQGVGDEGLGGQRLVAPVAVACERSADVDLADLANPGEPVLAQD